LSTASRKRNAKAGREDRAANEHVMRESGPLIAIENHLGEVVDEGDMQLADVQLALALSASEAQEAKEAQEKRDELETVIQLRRKINALQRRVRMLTKSKKYLSVTPAKTPRLHASDFKYLKKKTGKSLRDIEKRAILHTYQVCNKEKNTSMFLHTGNPVLRTSHYHGLSERTVRDIVNGKVKIDRRGKYERKIPAASRSFAGYIREVVVTMNFEGKATTISRVRKTLETKLREVYAANMNLMPVIPKREMVRKIMNQVGFSYGNASKAKSYVETANITKRRQDYISARYSKKYEDAIFVWQDESYVHHHHVWNKAWFNPTGYATVLRKGKGRRYVIVHAGCAEYGWIGKPRVWVSLYFLPVKGAASSSSSLLFLGCKQFICGLSREYEFHHIH
jgi:hypothetical protein